MIDPQDYRSECIPSKFDDEILRDLFTNAPANHDRIWRNIQPEEAAFIRKALIVAQQLRDHQADPGDAYLQGIAITLEAERRLKTRIRELLIQSVSIK